MALGLLGSHVAGRAQHEVGPREVRAGFERLGQAEVGDLGRAVVAQQDVGRLEVAVDDPQPVRLGDSARHLLEDPRRRDRGPGRTIDPPAQAARREVLHRVEGQAVALAPVVDLDDVGMPQPGDRFGLGQEALQRLLGGVPAGRDHLEGDPSAEADLAGAIDHAHPAAAQDLDELITLRHGAEAEIHRAGAGRRPVDGEGRV